MYPKVYDKNMNKVAYLENAKKINYNTPENALWKGGFTLPLDDPKNEHCQLFNRVRLYRKNGEEVGLFRIMKSKISKKGEQTVAYQLEHVLGLLIDPSIPGYHQTDNQTTTYNINFLLGFQKQQDWVLGQCDFGYLFSYKWENESAVYNALISLFKPFPERYHIGFDTSVYPWQLNITRAETEPTARIRAGYNMQGITKEEDGYKVVSRVMAKGYGEGVNQLESPWYEAEPSLIDKYEGDEYILVDRSIEDQEALNNVAQNFLANHKIPPVTYQIDAGDVSEITGLPIDKFRPGQIVRVTDEDMGATFDARVEKVNKKDATGKPGEVGLELNRKVFSIVDSQKEMRDRQRVEETYSMGSTNIYAYSFEDNCDENYPAIIRFYVPPETVKNNKVYVSFQTTKFRRYVKSMASAGQTTVTSSAGGDYVSTVTSEAGGSYASTVTSAAGGDYASTVTSAAGGGSVQTTEFKLFQDLTRATSLTKGAAPTVEQHYHNFNINAETYSHDHSVTIPTHKHDVTIQIPSHTHAVSIQIPNHSHNVKIQIPKHTHLVQIPSHVHKQVPGIWEAPNRPNSITLEVDGNVIPDVNLDEDNFDIKPFMSKDAGGEIEVGKTHVIKIYPDDLARISANVFVQLFIQSRI